MDDASDTNHRPKSLMSIDLEQEVLAWKEKNETSPNLVPTPPPSLFDVAMMPMHPSRRVASSCMPTQQLQLQQVVVELQQEVCKWKNKYKRASRAAGSAEARMRLLLEYLADKNPAALDALKMVNELEQSVSDLTLEEKKELEEERRLATERIDEMIRKVTQSVQRPNADSELSKKRKRAEEMNDKEDAEGKIKRLKVHDELLELEVDELEDMEEGEIREKPEDEAVVWAFNLSPETESEALENLFRQKFDIIHAKVTHKVNPADSSSPISIGTIQFLTKNESRKAVKTYQGAELDGHSIELTRDKNLVNRKLTKKKNLQDVMMEENDEDTENTSEKNKRKSRSEVLWVYNLSPETDSEALENLFRERFVVINAKVTHEFNPEDPSTPISIGVVEFRSKKQANKALGIYQGAVLNGRCIKLMSDKKKNNQTTYMEKMKKMSKARADLMDDVENTLEGRSDGVKKGEGTSAEIPGEPNRKTVVWVYNLSAETDRAALEKLFGEQFDVKCAKVIHMVNPSDPVTPISMAHVHFLSNKDANDAIDIYQGMKLDGKSIELTMNKKKMEWMKELFLKVSDQLIVRDVPLKATPSEVESLFSSCVGFKSFHMPKNVHGLHLGFGFVDFEFRGDAARALDALERPILLHGMKLGFEISKSQNELVERERRLYVDSMRGSNATEEKIGHIPEGPRNEHVRDD